MASHDTFRSERGPAQPSGSFDIDGCCECRSNNAGIHERGFRSGRAPPHIVMDDALALADTIRSRQVSCVEVMTDYLDHIERINPKVNAIVAYKIAPVCWRRQASGMRSLHVVT